jgi:hypothetical protein
MGAFVADFLSKGAEKLGDKFDSIVGRAASSTMGKGVLNIWGNQKWELSLTDGGKAVEQMHNDYIRIHDQTLDAETSKLIAIREWHSNDAAARKAVPVDASINQYHAHAVATNHPVQNITSAIVDAGDGKLTQQELMLKNQQIARLTGINGSYGEHYENATPIIASMLKDKNPDVVNNAHRVADIISNQTRDTCMFKDHTGTNTPQSSAKKFMNQAFNKANRYADEGDKKIPLLSTEPTYTPQTSAERTAHRVMDTMLIPFVALPHIGQLFNVPASSPLRAMGASLLRLNEDEMHKTVEAASITASTTWSALYRDILGETGKVAEWTHSPTVGKILARTIHQPGFSFVRRAQLNLAGSVGFHSAIYWAHNFAEDGSKIAKARLEEIGIDPAEVLAQKGELTEAQLQKGVYHYTNNRMFFNKGIDNSLWQNRNVFTRAGFMYHSFVNSQASFMKRELMLMARSGDIKGIAQYAGTLGILFPMVAPLIGGAEVMLRTGSPVQGIAHAQQNYSQLFDPDSPGAWLSNYFDLLSHLGAAGVYFNYINAIKANRLMSAVAGPLAGAATTDITDAYHAAFQPTKAGEHAIDPLMRDVLKQTIPVAGSALAHTFFPTTAESKQFGGATTTNRSRRHIGRRRAY